MVDATPDGQHMSIDTFSDTLDFIIANQFMMVMISGGEPLEHPEFFDIMEMAKDSPLVPIILSNGMFLADTDLRDAVLDLGVMIQVTNDPRYYPKTISEFEHPLIGYEHNIRAITSLGRAKDNGITPDRRAPMCFNLRSMVRNTNDFARSVLLLRSYQKMCTPSINIDGSIVAGEASSCCKIGVVTNSLDHLAANLKHMKCNKCGLEDNLEPAHREAIGLGA